MNTKKCELLNQNVNDALQSKDYYSAVSYFDEALQDDTDMCEYFDNKSQDEVYQCANHIVEAIMKQTKQFEREKDWESVVLILGYLLNDCYLTFKQPSEQEFEHLLDLHDECYDKLDNN